jgi:hypothetical protein
LKGSLAGRGRFGGGKPQQGLKVDVIEFIGTTEELAENCFAVC